MNRYLMFGLGILAMCGQVRGEFVGAELPLEDFENVDSWSGVPVMYGNVLPAGESVTTVRYYLDDNRFEADLYNVVPLIVVQEDGSDDAGEGVFSVWEIGPPHTPDDIGEQEFAWGSSLVPSDGNLYHPAALQWQIDADDGAGGAISFGGSGGDGMHFFNVNTTDYIPGEDIGEVEPGLVLSDLQTHSSAAGGRYYQLNFETGSATAPGDFNADGNIDAIDIDLLTADVIAGTGDLAFDLTNDGAVDQGDRDAWVNVIKNTYFGDSNLDGEFSSADFVVVFQAGEYEDREAGNSTWATGDWNGDGEFASSDFVTAFQAGGYELGPKEPMAVPEPTSIILAFIGMISLMVLRQRKR